MRGQRDAVTFFGFSARSSSAVILKMGFENGPKSKSFPDWF